MRTIQIKEIFRYSRPYKRSPETIDGFRNHFAVTSTLGDNLILLEKGINQIGETKAIDGKRTPAIIIRSSPHKIGSHDTPWQDVFDVDNGLVRYFGDNRTPGNDPALSPGNKALLEVFRAYYTLNQRKHSVPLIFYKAVSRNNKAKGFIEFNGFGIIKGIELITQYDRNLNQTFSNYVFNFIVFSLAKNHEQFNWEWIIDRRNKSLTLQDTLTHAPVSWIEWIKHGPNVLEKNRRRVSKLFTVSRGEQVPKRGSIEEKTLMQVYAFYQHKKSTFEGLAAAVTGKILNDTIGKYREGWITPASSNGGADFYGRIEIGNGFGKAKLIVLGQAKCERLNSPTGGNHVARTVARLKRGWIGAYVTTSFYSEAVQREVIEDEYPIMLINGLKLSETILKILHDEGHADLNTYLSLLNDKYIGLISIRQPDELLFE